MFILKGDVIKLYRYSTISQNIKNSIDFRWNYKQKSIAHFVDSSKTFGTMDAMYFTLSYIAAAAAAIPAGSECFAPILAKVIIECKVVLMCWLYNGKLCEWVHEWVSVCAFHDDFPIQYSKQCFSYKIVFRWWNSWWHQICCIALPREKKVEQKIISVAYQYHTKCICLLCLCCKSVCICFKNPQHYAL